MKKILSYVVDNLLFFITLFLLVFIPLYPKFPLIDIKNTWVYVRVEDFLVLATVFIWLVYYIRKKVVLNAPLTLPIIIFWIVGAIGTIHGVVLVFPGIANVFPNVAFLSFMRHIEYMSLFFIAYSSVKDRKQIWAFIAAITITLFGVVAYGLGQKYLGFPAYLTMNEEYAKGVAIRLSDLSRIPSTFAGHYDLAAYLVLIVPILASLVIGVKNILGKAVLAVATVLGVGLLFMTVSRVSFFVLIVALFAVLYFQKKKLILYSLPFIVILGFLFVSFKPTLLARFSNTVREVNVLVDGKTGTAVGQVKFVPFSYFKDKVIKQQIIGDRDQLDSAMVGQTQNIREIAESTSAATLRQISPDAQVPLVFATNVSTGENLPQGTGYINLSLSPVVKRVGNFFYELAPNIASSASAQVLILHGDFIIKKASAYDLSFTTRFQGEWPHALLAFERNVLVGSGYGAVSLAVDNNYLRMLGETGLLGTLSFLAIFLVLGIYIKKVLPDIRSSVVKSFILGFAAGLIGLALNATLIDVFEASKIAFLMWMLIGVVFGIINSYKTQVNIVEELKAALTSDVAVGVYLLIVAGVIFSRMLGNYFVADDFTWFRWAADCHSSVISLGGCSSFLSTISHYFTEAGGFFWRPGTKTYFLLMYSVFWLNQTVYHAVSIVLHFIVAFLFFLLAKKILKNSLLAAGASLLFLIMSGYVEIVFWISATGHLFNAVFMLLALIMYISWREKKQALYLVISLLSTVLSLLFYETGVVVPLLILAYELVYNPSFNIKRFFKRAEYLILFVPNLFYLVIRFLAGSHWQGGDYSYNLVKLPFNLIGNLVGYVGLTFMGPLFLPAYEKMRTVLRGNLLVAGVIALVLIVVVIFAARVFMKTIEGEDRKTVLFAGLFFVISLLPFIGFGNITARYSYLASLGLIIIFVFILRKLYRYLLAEGRPIAISVVVLIIAAFSLLHIIEVQQIHQDWNGAGLEAKNFFTAIDDSYSDYWSSEPMQLHFVNVPLKNGEAWVFPWGISDATWFAFKNPKAQVYTDPQVTYDLQSKISRNFKVFEFNGDGSVTEVQPPTKSLGSPTPTPTSSLKRY